MKTKFFLTLLLIFASASFVSASCTTEDLTESIIIEKMIWNIPELSGYTFGGVQEHCSNYEGYDLRYRPQEQDQHSEFWLREYNTEQEANSTFYSYFNPTSPNKITTKIIYDNTILEQTIETEPQYRSYIWISGKNILVSWNGNDIGTIHDDDLMNLLAEKYLDKYPSTYNLITQNPQTCCKECVNVHSAISGRPASERCLTLKDVDSSLPYHLSERCKTYFNEDQKTIQECINLISLCTQNTDCNINQICLNRQCVNNLSSCTNECSSVGQKRCEGDNSQTCGNYDGDECLEWNFGMICPYGCSNGICNYILEEQENGTIFYIAPNITSGPIEMPKENELTTQPALVICQGCELDNKCYPYGFRKENNFCSDLNNQFIEQKEADSICENNFECSTNICIDDQCISKGIWQKFLEWFKRLFG